MHTHTLIYTQSDSIWFRFTELFYVFVWKNRKQSRKNTNATNSVGTQFISLFVDIIKVFICMERLRMNEYLVYHSPYRLYFSIHSNKTFQCPIRSILIRPNGDIRPFFGNSHKVSVASPHSTLIENNRRKKSHTTKCEQLYNNFRNINPLIFDDIKHAQTIYT